MSAFSSVAGTDLSRTLSWGPGSLQMVLEARPFLQGPGLPAVIFQAHGQGLASVWCGGGGWDRSRVRESTQQCPSVILMWISPSSRLRLLWLLLQWLTLFETAPQQQARMVCLRRGAVAQHALQPWLLQPQALRQGPPRAHRLQPLSL